jgi:hypothetical protein
MKISVTFRISLNGYCQTGLWAGTAGVENGVSRLSAAITSQIGVLRLANSGVTTALWTTTSSNHVELMTPEPPSCLGDDTPIRSIGSRLSSQSYRDSIVVI